ncbi:MAG: YggT family protein [Gemmatimonadales bacterium]
MGVPEAVDLGTRAVALAAVGVAGVIAATHWAVRRRMLDPFGAWSKSIRSVSDPLLRPIEHRLVRRGGNPQDATFWLLGLAIVGGLVLINLARWLVGVVATLLALGSASPAVWVRVALDWSIGVLMLALIVRVIGGWLGLGPFNRWMRPVYFLTDWLVNPIRRLLPQFGMLDLSPLLAYVALMLVRGILYSALR